MNKQPSKDLTKLHEVDKKSDEYAVGYLNGYCAGVMQGKSEGYDIGRKVGIEIARRRYRELNPSYDARRVKK